MSKNKLAKFADMASYPNVFQATYEEVHPQGYRLRGRWHEEVFHNNNPIILELGCGHGEYTVGLARAHSGQNFIGVDIKGARMWHGATEAVSEGLCNVAFLRTHIELITYFFAPGEVSEIWLTFPDPQMHKAGNRLTAPIFLRRYSEILPATGGDLHLKCDSNFMFTYTEAVAAVNRLETLVSTRDLYTEKDASRFPAELTTIQTAYERQWLSRGIDIKYLRLRITPREEWLDSDIEIPLDSYRSYGRDQNSSLQKHK